MGKPEREDVEQMERTLVERLNGYASVLSQDNTWESHLSSLEEYFLETSLEFDQVKHIGNEYGDTVGDIKLEFSDGTEQYFELKVSETETGKGTLANISQDSITRYGLVKEAKSWSDYRKQQNFKDQVEGLIERYSSFPGDSELDFDDKARFIRDHEEHDSEARQIKSKIEQLAEQNKVNYIQHLSEQEIDTYRVRGFLFCLLNGIHTIGEINDFFDSVDEDKFEKMAPNLTTLYVNQTGSGCEVSEEEIAYRRIDERFDEITLDFPDRGSGHTFVSLVGKIAEGESISILRLVFHWKNVFQGIKTPCLNVFLEYDPE